VRDGVCSFRAEHSTIRSGVAGGVAAVRAERRTTQMPCSLDDPGVSGRPAVAFPGEQAHPTTVSLYAEATAIIFYFVQPVGSA
jgi:hypothetical protein